MTTKMKMTGINGSSYIYILNKSLCSHCVSDIERQDTATMEGWGMAPVRSVFIFPKIRRSKVMTIHAGFKPLRKTSGSLIRRMDPSQSWMAIRSDRSKLVWAVSWREKRKTVMILNLDWAGTIFRFDSSGYYFFKGIIISRIYLPWRMHVLVDSVCRLKSSSSYWSTFACHAKLDFRWNLG